ncbi:unnamed protein product [Euphydryas editha]|uniref:Dynein axonemal assembly factor 1 homolog n=1 Tax=Euphydryas editha TaxID=104508 RepID=A0AAU9UFA1_EUPED|nr:unnamed protein product [Euphydryas editha]
MEIPNSMVSDPAYIETKKAELKEFFKDAKFPQSVIDKAIENELKPLTQGINIERPYIAASAPGAVKSEYEVMTGQPFTNVEDHNKPLTTEEIKDILKDSPIIAEKARQIQIVINQESHKDIAVPLDKINLSSYDDLQAALKSADGDIKKQDTIKYKNMQVLMNAAAEYRSKSQIHKSNVVTEETGSEETNSSDEKEFEAIDKVVTEYTNKSYEIRFQETKEMLQQLADKHEDPNEKFRENRKLEIKDNPILKESSICLVKSPKGQSSFDVIKESYAINDALNIPLKDNPINLDLSGKMKNKVDLDKLNNKTVEKIFPKSLEVKLKDTENVLSEINCILSKDEINTDKNYKSTELLSSIYKSKEINQVQEHNDTSNAVTVNNQKVKYDEKMEETLHNALENIYEVTKTEHNENNELEFKEMKNLARNIVEGAENLSTLIKEDITNKLNSMNELLNDVNEALENSRKSSLAYKKLKEEGEIQKLLRAKAQDNIQKNINSADKEEKSVSQLEIDDIHSAINKLKAEITCHETRINTSKANYETRNQECKDFIKELDGVLEKSHSILHPKSLCNTLQEEVNSTSVEEVIPDNGNKEKVERNKKIDRLLYDIKDKMKDNKEVLRLANNLLRREENKKAPTSKAISHVETDDKAKGDYARNDEILEKTEIVPPLVEEITDKMEEEDKKKREKEEKQKEFQMKIDKEFEEMNKGPRMTKEFIRNLCKQHKLYCTPYLNDILYLHFKGFSKIENLEEYTGLKCIFLENNGIQRIEGLDTLSELKCLYLHYNIVRKIENLGGCPKLDTLNLDHNFVTKIENLDVVPDLQTLSISHNMLSSVDDLDQLRHCKKLSVLDLSYNRIEDPLIVDVLADIALLKVLVLTGNPVVRNIPAYRKTLTLRLKELLNLDNRPVFPRDRACAEAWQRGGVQEEVAERRRWIAKDQEKVMESVRYLIKMRDENKAKREAREKKEREEMGLPPVEIKDSETDSKQNKNDLEAENVNIQESDLKTKCGVAEDLLTESEPNDTTSESDSSDSDNDANGENMSNIEWSQIDKGKHLIQELREEQNSEEQWSGFGMPSNTSDSNTSSDLNAINNLLFNQTPHVERKGITEKLKESIGNSIKETKVEETETDEPAKRKPLIEIIESYNKRSQENESNNKGNKVLVEKAKTRIIGDENTTDKTRNNSSKPVIIELNNEEKEEVKSNNLKDVKNSSDVQETKQSSDTENVKSHTSNQGDAEKSESGNDDDDGVAFIKYMNQMCSKTEDDNLDLKPSAEDLEIFKEIEKEQKEREARIARGEPAVDPMKLYDAKTMEEFHRAQEPVPAHALEEKNFVTNYDKHNAYDRIALSQLTGGDVPDETKVKLTHVPGAVLYQYVEKQFPVTELQYNIGDEEVESALSSADTESIHISNDSNESSSESDILESPKPKNKQNKPARPCTASKKDGNKIVNEDIDKDNRNSGESKSWKDKGLEGTSSSYQSSYEIFSNMDRNEAKKSIINTINSYDDNRFPSQGVNYSDMDENARIEDSVATEILQKTMKYEEQEMYKQLDMVTSHASRVDNSTNAIIEQMSDELENEYTLPELSRILETHIQEEELHHRTLSYVNYIPSPTESVADEDDTLVPSRDVTLEDTLTEDNKPVVEENEFPEANDSGICNDSISTEKVNDEIKEFDDVEENCDEVKSELNDLKVHDASVDDEVFEDCVDDINNSMEKLKIDDSVENYTLEMKLALGINKD